VNQSVHNLFVKDTNITVQIYYKYGPRTVPVNITSTEGTTAYFNTPSSTWSTS